MIINAYYQFSYDVLLILSDLYCPNCVNYYQMGSMILRKESNVSAQRTSISKINNGTLSLCKMALIDEDLPRVVCGDLREVKSLLLRENCICGEGLTALIANPTLRLIKLNIASNGLTDESLSYLGRAEWQLRELLLNKNNITGYGLKYLSKMPLKQLQLLNLNQNYVTDRGAEELAEWSCSSLAHLYLFGNCLKDKGVLMLLSWRIPKLTHFHIADNCHTGQGVALLLRAQWLGMRQLQLNGKLVARWERDFLTQLLRRKWEQCDVYL